MRLAHRIVIAAMLVTGLATTAARSAPPAGNDWPQFRGPNRDGHSPATDLPDSWPEDGLPERWRTPLGASGYSGLAISENRVVTMFGQPDGEYVVALSTATGAEQWRLRVDDHYRDGQGDGPRSTPSIADGRVFALSASGKLVAASLEDGRPLWRIDLRSDYGGRAPQWGYSTSPLLDSGRLYIEAGGRRAGVVALDPASGEEIWKSLSDAAGYSAPILATVADQQQLLMFTGQRIVGLAPDDGNLLWSSEWQTSYGVNAATPLFVAPDRLFIASGYGVGGALLRIPSTSGDAVETLWRTGDLENQFSSSILVDGYLYGFNNSVLECFDVATGERMWRSRGYGHGSLIHADGHLYVLGDRGQLALVQPNPAEHSVVSSSRPFDSRTWTAPALAHRTLYLRDERQVIALSLDVPTAQ